MDYKKTALYVAAGYGLYMAFDKLIAPKFSNASGTKWQRAGFRNASGTDWQRTGYRQASGTQRGTDWQNAGMRNASGPRGQKQSFNKASGGGYSNCCGA